MSIKDIILIITVHCFFASNVLADDTNLINNNIESSSTFSKKDTAKLYEQYKKHGSLNKLFGESFRKINKSELLNKEYHGFSEMIEEFVPAYPLNLGSSGLFNSFSFFGTNPNNISFSFNGRPITDIEYSSYNPEQLCTEFFENVEVLTGSDAVILGDNSSGALINLQEIRYNTKSPYTKLWYSQGGNGFLSADGIYSQNFAPNFNFTFGFRRQTGQGRYENSWVDGWNVRGLIRWTPDEKTNISLVEYFTNHGMGLNGGIDTSNSLKEGATEIFDENYAVPYYTNYNERVFRHDMTLSITRQVSDDSSSILSGNIFASNSNWEIESRPFRVMDVDTIVNGKYMSRYYGVNVNYEQKVVKSLYLKVGAEAYLTDLKKSIIHDRSENSSFSGYAMARLDIFDFLFISGGSRYRIFDDKSCISEGIKLNFNINKSNNFFIDLSLSERLPSVVERMDLENEKHFLLISEYEIKLNNTDIKLGLSFRSIDNQIFYHDIFRKFLNADGYSKPIYSSYAVIEQKLFKNFVIDAIIQNYNQVDESLVKYPQIFAKLTMYYEIEAGRSILSLGFTGKVISSFTGETFLPQNRGYMTYDSESDLMYDGLKVFASAKLGNAYVKASLENIVGSGYYTVPIYPYYNRNFRLSFIWSFLD